MSDEHLELRAYIFSGAFVVILTVLILQFVFPALFSPKDQDFSVFEQPSQNEMELDDLATKGQQYIKSLALYDTENQPPILLMKTEPTDNDRYQLTYEVDGREDVVFSIKLEMVSGHVVDHHIETENQSKSIRVFEPESDEIIAMDTLSVKGRSTTSEAITVSLFNQVGELTVQETVAQYNELTQVFSHSLNISKLQHGSYFLEVKSQEEKVVFPIIIASAI